MTLSQLYHMIEGTNFHALSLRQQVDTIQRQAELGIPSRAEAERWARCMRLDPEILQNAHHRYALELSLVARVENRPEIVEWMASKLHNYQRVSLIGQTERAIPIVCANIEIFDEEPLENSIMQIVRDDYKIVHRNNPAQLAEKRARVLERLQRIVERREVRRNQQIAQQVQDNPRNDLKDTETKQEFEYAQINNCLRVTLHDENGNKMVRFLRRSDIDKFDRLFSVPVDNEEQDCCVICMAAKVEYNCGREKCSAGFCHGCFHTWFSKNPKCPNCQGEHIPLPARH